MKIPKPNDPSSLNKPESDNEFTIAIKQNWRKWLRDALIIALIVTGVMAWQTRDMLETDGSTRVAQQHLVSLEGEVQAMLSSTKPNLIYFFAPWCQICALSIGNLAYLNEDKVNVVVIALDYKSKEEVQAFVSQHEVTSPVLLGTHTLKDAFAIQGYPSYYLVNQEYYVTSRSFGYSSALGLKLRETFSE